MAAAAQPTELPSFEVASVKPGDIQASYRGQSSSHGGPGTNDPGRATFTNVTMMGLLIRAYRLDTFQIAGPSWLDSEAYDITVSIPAGTTKEQYRQMLQNLLIERFHMVLHHETRDLPSYELVVAKRGSKLKETTLVEGAQPAAPPGPFKTDADGFPVLDRATIAMRMTAGPKGPSAHLSAKAQPVSALAGMLRGQVRAPVVDKTGLTGKYDFTLEYAPQGFATAGDDAAPPLEAAIQEQLGLKLEAKKVPTDVIVIDKADKVPTAN
jgi:uncharacterized protein (TIGR03435 family)